MEKSKYAIELIDIEKRFGPVYANNKVCLKVETGSIHGVIGENGAGKSTLMSILYGFYKADSGEIKVFGNKLQFNDSHQAIRSGIGMVHQHFMLVDNFTVIENVILGSEGGAILHEGIKSAREKLTILGEDYGLKVDLDATIDSLSVGSQQRVEILKALYKGARVLILDEPTGVLTPQETQDLFRIFTALKEEGVTIILITHKLREIISITDNVSVMRSGKMVAHRQTSQTNQEDLAELMVGRKVLLKVDKEEKSKGKELLKVNSLSVRDSNNIYRLKDISFEIHAGEILGIAGVSGNGQSTLLKVLSGITPVSSGEIEILGHTINKDNLIFPDKIREFGLAHVPEDRQRMGLISNFSASETSILGYHNNKKINNKLILNNSIVRENCESLMSEFDVRPRNPDLKSDNFSGGNQQKLIVAREFENDPKVLLIGQPTRGVDIGAIEFIHKRIIALRDSGKAILLVSVELDEIMSISDRIVVLCDGQVSGRIDSKDADEKTLGMMMANVFSKEENLAEISN